MESKLWQRVNTRVAGSVGSGIIRGGCGDYEDIELETSKALAWAWWVEPKGNGAFKGNIQVGFGIHWDGVCCLGLRE